MHSKIDEFRYELFVHQPWKKSLSSWLRPFFWSLSKILALSTEFFVLDLQSKSPKLYSLKKQDYVTYESNQIRGNTTKITKIQREKGPLDETFYGRMGTPTLKVLQEILERRFNNEALYGVCHGVRTGFENRWLQSQLAEGSLILGTDISPTIEKIENGIKWDFHEEREDWLGKFDFVFTNSLDHAFDPLKAVEVWLRQIKEEGLIFIELSPNSGRLGYTGLDIFSIEPEIFPFYLMQNLGGKLIVRSIHFIEKGNNRRVLFEIGHFHAARIT